MPVEIWVGLGIINFSGFVMMGIDKRRAKKGSRHRIRERTLLGIATVFGALGVYLGLKWFRHKTFHRNFTITLPILLLIQIIVLVFILGRVF